MLGLNGLLQQFPFQSPTSNNHEVPDGHQTPFIDSEWLEIEEPVGYFFPRMERKRRHLLLDQVHHVLRYANYKRVVCIHDISLVTCVEAIGSDGLLMWWMSILDPVTLQVWVVHFPTRERINAWATLLKLVIQTTGGNAIVQDIVELDNQQPEVPELTTPADLSAKDLATRLSAPHSTLCGMVRESRDAAPRENE